MKSELYKEHYAFEWEHRSHLISAVGIPIAGVALVGGALATMVESVPTFGGVAGIVFSVSAALAGISLAISVVFVFRSQYGYTYQRLPTPLKLKEHYDRLANWHRKRQSAAGVLESDFEQELNQRIAEAVEVNAANNVRRAAFVYRANLFLALSLVAVSIAAVSYLIQKRAQEPTTYKVQLVPPQP